MKMRGRGGWGGPGRDGHSGHRRHHNFPYSWWINCNVPAPPLYQLLLFLLFRKLYTFLLFPLFVRNEPVEQLLLISGMLFYILFYCICIQETICFSQQHQQYGEPVYGNSSFWFLFLWTIFQEKTSWATDTYIGNFLELTGCVSSLLLWYNKLLFSGPYTYAFLTGTT